MATRLYFPSNLACPVIPILSGGWTWDVTDQVVNRGLSLAKTLSTFVTQSGEEDIITFPYGEAILLRTYVSPPLLNPITLDGTVQMQMRCMQSLGVPPSPAAAAFYTVVRIYIVSNDGQTVNSNIQQYFGPNSIELSLTNHFMISGDGTPADLYGIDALAGERLVINIGLIVFGSGYTNNIGTIEFGDSATTDLPVDDTTTDQANPWIEFSQQLDFGSETSETSVNLPIIELYSHDKQVLPSNVDIIPLNDARTTWHVPQIGTCELHSMQYLYVQTDAALTWTFAHTLPHRGVIVQVYDNNSNEILPNNIQLSRHSNTIIITFDEEANGYAVLTAVGGMYTQSSVIALMDHIVLGNGTDTNTFDAVSANGIKNPVASGQVVSVTEDSDCYYVKAHVTTANIDLSVTEIGAFSAAGDLLFYSYIYGGVLYKNEGFNFTAYYRISKD